MRRPGRVPAAPPAIQPDGWEVFAHLPVATLLVDSAGWIARANIAAEELLGASEAALAARPLSGQLAALLARPEGVRAHDVELGDIAAGLRADISVTWVGERPGWKLLLIQPRTDHAQPEVPKAAATIAAMLAHEIKNPLAGIRGAAQLLGEGQDGETRELTELIRLETDRIRRLVERVEGLSEEGALAREPVNLNEVLHHVSWLAAGLGPGIQIREDYDPSLPPIAGDRDSLIQFFLNLVKNAAEATDLNGEITLATAFRYGARHEGRALPIEARVSDRGPGVPAAIAGRLFQPFVSSKAAGRGLGLAIVAKIAADHEAMVDYLRQDGCSIFRARFAVGGKR